MYSSEFTPPFADILPTELTNSVPEYTAAVARIESVRIKAREAFLKAIRRNLWPQKDLRLFANYVISVWFALNHELCLLGRQRKWRFVWGVIHIRQRSEKFAEDFAIWKAH